MACGVTSERLDQRARARGGGRRPVHDRHDAGSRPFEPQIVAGASRFIPGTVTLLTQDPADQEPDPVAITVSGYRGQKPSNVHARESHRRRLALRTTGGQGLDHGLRRLARARLSLASRHRRDADDHVQHLPTDHPDLPPARPQSKFCIPFDDVLLVAVVSKSRRRPDRPTSSNSWSWPTTTAPAVIYFDDDPKVTLKQASGSSQADFTIKHPVGQVPRRAATAHRLGSSSRRMSTVSTRVAIRPMSAVAE